jgi:hypothetical protein
MILQSLINAVQDQTQTFDIWALLGGGTLGSIVTQLIQKYLNRKEDSTNISTQQAALLKTVNNDLMKVVEQLQEIACYVKPCKERINGDTGEGSK